MSGYQSYLYCPCRQGGCSFKIMRAFKRAVIAELQNNPDGVQLPLAMVVMNKVKKKKPSSNWKVREKYGENYGFLNDNTDGYLITTKLRFFNGYETKKNTLYNSRFFKFRAGKKLRVAQWEVANDRRWVALNDFVPVKKKK